MFAQSHYLGSAQRTSSYRIFYAKSKHRFTSYLPITMIDSTSFEMISCPESGCSVSECACNVCSEMMMEPRRPMSMNESDSSVSCNCGHHNCEHKHGKARRQVMREAMKMLRMMRRRHQRCRHVTATGTLQDMEKSVKVDGKDVRMKVAHIADTQYVQKKTIAWSKNHSYEMIHVLSSRWLQSWTSSTWHWLLSKHIYDV